MAPTPGTMAKLALDRAPPPDLPRRFLLTAPLWGVVAGVLLAVDGEGALLSRWAPATLALVHAFTLGVLGNAMFGSLLQFLPVAAGVRVRGGPALGRCMHGLLNTGVLALLVGFRHAQPAWYLAAGVCLVVAFALLVASLLPGLLATGVQRLLRLGIAFAVSMGLATALLGGAMLLGLAGASTGWPLLPWANIHAAWGVLGWIVVLLASVAQVVMPMFQGTESAPAPVQRAGLGVTVAGLVLGTWSAARGDETALRLVVAGCSAGFALLALAGQWRARRSRNAGLVQCWRAGLLALLAAAGALAAGLPALPVGVLAIGIGLPLLVVGMQLEIVAFLGWVELQRGHRRGMDLPSVQRLLPDAHKRAALQLQWGAAAMLLLAVAWPSPVLARMAGAAMACAYAVLALVLFGVRRRGQRCLALRRAMAVDDRPLPAHGAQTLDAGVRDDA